MFKVGSQCQFLPAESLLASHQNNQLINDQLASSQSTSQLTTQLINQLIKGPAN